MSGVPTYAGGPGQCCCPECPCIDPTTCPPAYYATTSGWPSSYPSGYPTPAPNPYVVYVFFTLVPPVWNDIPSPYYGVGVRFDCQEISPGVCVWTLEVYVAEVLDGQIEIFTPNECLPLGPFTVPISNSDGTVSFDVTVILATA